MVNVRQTTWKRSTWPASRTNTRSSNGGPGAAHGDRAQHPRRADDRGRRRERPARAQERQLGLQATSSPTGTARCPTRTIASSPPSVTASWDYDRAGGRLRRHVRPHPHGVAGDVRHAREPGRAADDAGDGQGRVGGGAGDHAGVAAAAEQAPDPVQPQAVRAGEQQRRCSCGPTSRSATSPPSWSGTTTKTWRRSSPLTCSTRSQGSRRSACGSSCTGSTARPDKAAVADVRTDADGRAMLLTAEAMAAGRYRLLFHVGDYFTAAGNGDAGRVPGRGAGAVSDRRRGGGLPRAAVGVAVELLDVPGQLGRKAHGTAVGPTAVPWALRGDRCTTCSSATEPWWPRTASGRPTWPSRPGRWSKWPPGCPGPAGRRSTHPGCTCSPG